jgi:hypothetical protein
MRRIVGQIFYLCFLGGAVAACEFIDLNSPAQPLVLVGVDHKKERGAVSVLDDIDTDVIYSHGPAKLMMPEQILSSIEYLTGHQFDRGSRPYRIEAPASASLQASYVTHCQAMGGCPDHLTRERITTSSIIHAISLDRLAIEACVLDQEAKEMLPPDIDLGLRRPSPQLIDQAIVWHYDHFFGVLPRKDEFDASRDYVTAHREANDFNTFETAMRGHCVALTTSAKFVYY